MNQKRFSLANVNLRPTAGSKSNKGHRRSLADIFFNSSSSRSSLKNARRSITTQEHYESVTFVWLDLQKRLTTTVVSSLRSINDSVRVYTDSALCFDAIRSSSEKIFFISSCSGTELIATVHDFPAVEAIFVFEPDADNVHGNFPKLCGIFTLQDELFRELKEMLDVFEQVQLEVFVFEDDKEFLWRQLWKEELTHRKAASSKHDFVEVARGYYRNNIQTSSIINEFDKFYRSADVLSWCFRSPFPSRFLNHAVSFHRKEQLSLCRFLFADATRFFQQQPTRKFDTQVYRGMKLSTEFVDQFEAHVGNLVCTGGFFACVKSRTNALALASLPTYRPDLLPVLFKIDCESTDLIIEIANTLSSSSSSIVFDVCMAFRVMCINRGEMTIIKLKTAGIDGTRIAQDYLSEHKNETMDVLLDRLLTFSEPVRSLSIKRISTPVPMKNPMITADEWEARRYVDRGEINLALIAYKRIHPVSARILNVMGQLCADRKGDYDYALECHSQALKIQEQDGDDVSDTLTNLGNVHHHRRELDMALACHKRAVALRENANLPDPASLAVSLIGISNTYWTRLEYEEAITSAERALILRKTLVPHNETEVGKTLAMLGNIYHDCGNHDQALERCSRALAIFERTRPVDFHALAELLNNLGIIQQDLGAMDEAVHNLERAAEIYTQILPRGHPDRVSAETDLERVNELNQKNEQNLNTYL